MQQYSKEEDLEKFRQYGKDLAVEWETIKAKIKADKEREAAANK